MRTERPRSRLVVLAAILGISLKTSHVSRGGQVTREFFREVALAVGVPSHSVVIHDKVGLCRLICQRIGVPFETGGMTSRGARITNSWFEAVIGRFDTLRTIGTSAGRLHADSSLNAGVLAAHLRSEMVPPAGLDLGVEQACYCCGDVAGGRLQHAVLEAHSTLPYKESYGRLPSPKDFVAICPSCHKILHLRGIQAKVFRSELRP